MRTSDQRLTLTSDQRSTLTRHCSRHAHKRSTLDIDKR
jgi:hypothetical protein